MGEGVGFTQMRLKATRNVLYFDLGSGYMGGHLGEKTHQTVHERFVHFTV